jgi:predicted MFS family arabinose efflux permease
MTERLPSGPRAVTAVSFAVMGLGTAPAALVGYLGAFVRSDLHLSRAELGLVTSLFYGATGVCLFVNGRLCDIFGARRCSLVNAVLVMVAMGAVALQPTYAMLLGAAVLSGAAYALGNVATNVAVSALSPPGKAAFLIALKTAGVPAISATIALAGPTAANHLGWRAVAAMIAGLSVLVIPFIVGFLPDSRSHAGRAELAPLPKHIWWLPVAAGLMIFGSQPLLSWLAIYLHDEFEVSVSTAGVLTAIGSITSIGALITAARLTDRLGSPRRCGFVALICLVCAGGVGVVSFGSKVGLVCAMAGALFGLWSNMIAAGLTHAIVIDRAPDAVGRASGVALGGYFLGALVAPGTFGWIADARGYGPAWGVSAVALCLAALAYYRVQVMIPVVPHRKLAENPASGPRGPLRPGPKIMDSS